MVLYTAFVLVFYAMLFFDLESYWYRLLAVLTAIVFPSLAIISQFPDRVKEYAFWGSRWLYLVGYCFRLVGISVLGVLCIIVLLSDYSYLITVSQFYGVKLSFVFPIILVGGYFYLMPNRISSVFYVVRRLLYSPIRMISLVVGFVGIVFVGVYVLRSGNYISFGATSTEILMREFMDTVLFVRPRLKEFLVGYPMLMFAFWFVGRDLSRQWVWFFNALGVVALVSLINSFCHFHTPLIVSVYRTGLGLFVGIVFGTMGIVGYGVFKRVLKRYLL